MNHRHFKQILLANNIIPTSLSETKTALKLVRQKEKFILEDSAKALIHNKKILPIKNYYTIEQYFEEIKNITNQYYWLYIQINQFEAFLRTFVNHRMVKAYGIQWHLDPVMRDLNDFQIAEIRSIQKPSQALNSISFGTLELVFLNGSRYVNIFEKFIKKETILNANGTSKYSNKHQIKGLFSIIRNARNDICHHRRIGESIKTNPKYTKQRMSKSDVVNALNDLKILLEYDDRFDVQSIKLKYRSI
ncbi:MAG: hypothetical protein PHW18_05220 [Sulfuricurvum sp.]|uniref:hypothetical protein n=1 Tax=Sulfuricurvum sp. TaxID=2025608 RepID=UPI00262B3F9D|nr:hypothetical protein [Sulfuricurvum sp.]MDD2828956.1 hypothetical protein [Sulfuricurvum sp.]MDD4950055.1 hypothetical protein [Sulfuricurvum sp.]